MTERKELKRQLSMWKHLRNNLPRFIDCSRVYGDNYYTEDDYLIVDKEIKDVENKISEIDKQNKQ